jgi:hypothetical protein
VSERRGRALAVLLVRLYPRALREAHGEEMAAFLESRFARVGRHPLRALRVLAGAVRDLVVTWRAERLERRRLVESGSRSESAMGGLAQDLRYAARRLARTPVFSLGALAIMAIAIGATTGVFALVNAMLLAPPPYSDVSRVVNIYQDTDDGEIGSTSYPAYRDIAAMDGVFAAVGASTTGLREVNAQLPVDELDTLDGHLGSTLASVRMTAGVLGLFSILALLLAGIGIYTIVSFSVAGRMPEIGIRVALGAARGRVIRMVVGEVALTVGAGLVLGTALVVLLNARLGPSLGGRLEPVTLAVAAAVMALAVGVAAWLPARRAAAVDPVDALRGN